MVRLLKFDNQLYAKVIEICQECFLSAIEYIEETRVERFESNPFRHFVEQSPLDDNSFEGDPIYSRLDLGIIGVHIRRRKKSPWLEPTIPFLIRHEASEMAYIYRQISKSFPNPLDLVSIQAKNFRTVQLRAHEYARRMEFKLALSQGELERQYAAHKQYLTLGITSSRREERREDFRKELDFTNQVYEEVRNATKPEKPSLQQS